MATKPNTPDTTGPDSGEPTTSTSAQDASTLEGQKAAGVTPQQGTPSSAGGAATQGEQAAAVTRVQIEPAPDEPDVLYDGSNRPQREPVKADYKPFTW